MLSRRLLVLAAAGSGALILAGCAAPGATNRANGVGAAGDSVAAPAPPDITVLPADRAADVPLDAPVTVSSTTGNLLSVAVTGPAGATVPGQLSGNRRTWTATDGLDPGATYHVTATAVGVQGTHTTAASTFTTFKRVSGRLLTTANPDDGSTVGVGKTINLRFNTAIPTEQQAEVARHLVVTSTPAQIGAWHWFSPSEIHYRPENYWTSGTTVTLHANLHGVNAGNGYWGLANFTSAFTVGEKHVSLIDDTTHTMQVYKNDQLVYTWPVSMGKAGFRTLEGTLQVITKAYKVKMQSCSTFGGSACVPGSANYYDEYVYWDTAISTNGFFVHAAPWDLYQQGKVDVSHGCVNISTDRATTFYNMSVPGDIVVISHTGNVADLSNGEADWQIPFAQFDNTGNPAPTDAPPAGQSGGL